MLRAAIKSQLVVLGGVGWAAKVAQGEGVAEAGSETTKAASESAKTVTDGIIRTITESMNGNTEAQSVLIALCGKITFVLAILFCCFLLASAIGRFAGGFVTAKVDVTLGKFLNKAVRNVIMLVVGMVAMDMLFEVQLAWLAAVLAAAGFAVGMALQGTLSNFAAGIMLLVFRPFRVDDYISVAGCAGTVEEIDLFTTRLNGPDNRHIIVPNGEIFGAKLENYTRNSVRRVDVNVGAAYSADIKVTRKALERAVIRTASESVQANGAIDVPEPQVYLRELGASSVDWQLRVWCHPTEYWRVREDLTAAAKEALDQAGISIPFPQMDVHVVGKVLAKAA
jgi:small conductance mechanosensitive channel